MKIYDGIVFEDPFHITGTKCKVIKAEDLEQYQWHNLLKDPGDLPKMNKNVLFATTDGTIAEGEWNYTCWIQYRWTTHRSNEEVIAWKEMDPFWSCFFKEGDPDD